MRFINGFLLAAVLIVGVTAHAQGPQVSSTTPATGAIGAQVQIYGSGFGSSQGSSTVAFNGISATATSWSDGQITATVPIAATGAVTVAVGGVPSNVNVYFVVPPPVVTGVSPSSGTTGTQVTITGSGFGPSQGPFSFAYINNHGPLTISSWNTTQIVGTLPVGITTGPVTVVLDGVTSNPDVIFTTPDPIVTGITPSSGPVGTAVHINGSGFGASQGTSTIRINNASNGALVVSTWTDTLITATLPSTITTGPVQVTVGGIGSNSNIYYTVPPPQITSISPPGGVIGTSVTINGSGFQSTQGSSIISFNGHTPTVTSWSDTKIVANAPSGASGPVTVSVNNVTSNSDVTFKLPGPFISGLVPSSGPAGTQMQVQVNGSGFGTTQGNSTISIGGVPNLQATYIVSWSDTQIVIKIPPSAVSGTVTTLVSNVPSNADVNFTVPGPQVTSVSPSSGVAGAQVTINGSGFQSSQGNGFVYFNGVNAPVSSGNWSDTQITTTVPSSTLTGPVTVSVNSITSNRDVLFTTPNPIVTSISPTSGPVTTSVTINGSGFGATQGTLTIGGITASINTWNTTQITANVPRTARTGAVKVTVGTVGSNTDVSFTIPTPQITSISPTSGTIGTPVTVTGSAFQSLQNGGYITFNGVQATVSSGNWSDTQIVTTIPAGATTGMVRVFANNGDSSNMDQVFTLPNPVVSAVSPINGIAGTTPVTVSGSGFGSQTGNSISFGGISAPNINITSWSDTQIQTTVPSNANSGIVKVTNGGVSSNNNVTFTVGAVDVSSVNPPAGPIGTLVTVTGSGFGSSGTISFNGTNAVNPTWTPTQIQAYVPTGATSGAVKVVTGGVSSNTNVTFTVSNVVVNNVSPASAEAGAQFQINGSGFGSTKGTSSILFASAYAPTIVNWSDTQITAQAPNVALSGSIVVTVGSNSSNSNVNFTVLPPVISSVSPSSGPPTTQVTINGSGFGTNSNGNGRVTFNGITATVVPPWTDSQITVTAPATSTGLVSVYTGFLTSSQGIYFTVPGPQVASISPSSGGVNTAVTINGSGFQTQGGGSNTVKFYNSLNNAPITSWTDTQIVATVAALQNTRSGPITVNVYGVASNQDVIFNLPSPQITSVSPTSGAPNTPVTINGSGFGATAGTLTFYNGVNVPSANIGTWSDTQITATVPTQAVAGPIQVTQGGVPSNSNIYFAVPSPHVTSVSPAIAAIGTQVTISGSGFQGSQGTSTVCFGQSINGTGCATTYGSWSDTQIQATVPTSAITGPVYVYVASIGSNADVLFTLPNPQITGLSPSSSPAGTTTQVQVNGNGFGPSQGTSTVTFNGVSPNVVSWSDTQIVVTLPATVTTGQVKVVEGGVNSNLNINFTVPPPQVANLSPGSGTIGTQVAVNGSGFQASQGSNSKVTFNGGSAASVVSWSDTQIVAAVPAGTVTGPVQVFVNNISSNQDVDFALPNPQITSISPSNGAAGTQVQINGSGFGGTQGTSTLNFSFAINNGSAVASIVSWSDTQIVATVPTAAMTGAIDVIEGGVTSNANIDFTVPSPQITGITPSIGGVGNPATIIGSGFRSSQGTQGKVTFYGIAATITSWSDTQIQAVVPGNTATGPVQVVASDGEGSNYINYTVPNLTVTRISPALGPVLTPVTISGTGFGATQGTSTVSFEGQSAASITSWSDTQIVASVPVTATSGTVLVTVNNINSNNTMIFTVPAPVVGIPLPAGGVAGTQVTFNGQGFQATQRNSTVTFNGVVAPIVSWSDTHIVATVPIGATTGPLQATVNGVSGQMVMPFEVPNPQISSVSLSPVPVGGQFTIYGSGFGPNYGYSTDGGTTITGFLALNGVSNVGIVSWSDTQIVAQASVVGSGNLTVSKFDATSNAFPITVEGGSAITSIDPPEAEAGTTVTISGSGFGPQQNNSQVVFNGGTPAVVTSWSDTSVTAIVPDGIESGPVGFYVDTILGLTAKFVFDKTTHVTDSLGNQSAYTSLMYYGSWLALKTTGSGCSSCTIPGNVSNNIDRITGILLSSSDELGHITSYTYDQAMNVASVTQQLDSTTPVTTGFTYNSFGEPLTVTDPLGNVTTNTYDANGNLLTVTAPAPDSHTTASVTQFAYDTKGELTQITDPLNNLTKLAYNAAGLISTITDAQQNVTTYGYDQHGNRTSIKDALQNTTTFAYDSGDRLTKITYPDTTFVSFGYDYRGRRTSVTDQNGKTTTYAYDDADRLTSITDAANNVTAYAYDTENNLLSITDAATNVTSFTYDAFRRVTQTTFPSTLTESYIYDSASNLVNKTDRNGHSILYVYDALNRLTHKGYPDSTGVDYAYDLAGKIKQVTDPTGTYAMAYDNMGRLIGTTTTYSFLPGVPFNNTYAYDAGSNRKVLLLPDGSSDSYAYDTLNRLGSITDSLTGAFNFAYDALSRRTQLTRPNGVFTNYTYDSLSNLLSVLHQAGTSTLDGATYAYDPAGNRTAKTNKLNNITEQYTYDPLYQLTRVAQGTTTTESYSYDPIGNRLSSLGVGSFSYNSSNELTATSAATFTYDNNGNTLTKTDSTGTRTYTWDFENRLSSVVLPGASGTVTFAYDPFGRRIQKAFTQGSTTTTINYLYDGPNAIEEVDAGGSLMAHYAQGIGIDEPLSMVRSGTDVFYEADALGSVTSLSSSMGTISNSYTYDTFGNSTLNGSFVNPYRYTARDYDESGLQYSRARYYDPAVGRFLSADPVGFLGSGGNFYSYADNDPTNFTDPAGLQSTAPSTPPSIPGKPFLVPGGGAAGESAWARLLGVLGELAKWGAGAAIVLHPTPTASEAYDNPAYSWWPVLVKSPNFSPNKEPGRCQQQKDCNPCDPPVGTISYQQSSANPNTSSHYPFGPNHWHLWEMHQSPKWAGCQCFWVELGTGIGNPPNIAKPYPGGAQGGGPVAKP